MAYKYSKKIEQMKKMNKKSKRKIKILYSANN